uniref:Uncharacterized protein n=1 Tax=Meloidogyne enterolobii TaxID=390850 RepID=A0A6V7TLK2_MELEN|nr:unnamed protein product [Meloidogyne enterolobii]
MSSSSPTNQQPSNLIFLPPPPPSPYIFHLNSTNIPLLPTNSLNNSIEEQLNLNLLNSLLIKHFQQQQNNFKNSFKLPNNGQFNNNSLFTNNNTKVEDPIQNFHSPNNIILLPVGCHSLPDEKHIQLLGSPQTILPIAVHSNVLNNFPINPVILESKISSKILFKNCCNQKQNLLCHLPIAINKIINKQQIKEQKINNFIDVSCQTEDNNNYLITSSSSSSTSPSTFNNNSSNSGIEPLDLSISTNNKKQKQYLRKRASTTTILLQQPSKDLNKKEEITSKKSKKELIIFNNQKPTNSPSLSSPNTSKINTNNYQNVNYEYTIKNANNDKTKIKTSPQKRFPCDFCGDVSFLALETLEGHRKYYCRNRKIISVDTQQQLTTNNIEEKDIDSSNIILTKNNLIQHKQQNLPLICVSCGYKSLNLKGLCNHLLSSHSIRPPINTNSSSPSCVVENENGETKEF